MEEFGVLRRASFFSLFETCTHNLKPRDGKFMFPTPQFAIFCWLVAIFVYRQKNWLIVAKSNPLVLRKSSFLLVYHFLPFFCPQKGFFFCTKKVKIFRSWQHNFSVPKLTVLASWQTVRCIPHSEIPRRGFRSSKHFGTPPAVLISGRKF